MLGSTRAALVSFGDESTLLTTVLNLLCEIRMERSQKDVKALFAETKGLEELRALFTNLVERSVFLTRVLGSTGSALKEYSDLWNQKHKTTGELMRTAHSANSSVVPIDLINLCKTSLRSFASLRANRTEQSSVKC